tara:strand:- start:3579 stop:3923 length:345 start_codon:yes stop_codon:yes gene_type:complete
MSIEAIGWCKRQKCNTPSTKLVLFILSNYADQEHSCYPSEKHIASICGISDRQVRRCLAWLEQNNLIRKEMRSGTSNRYFLSVDAHVLTLRTPTTAYTKDKLKTKKGGKNALAG